MFRTAARRFESRHVLKDGAKLAALVAKAPSIDYATKSRWIARPYGAPAHVACNRSACAAHNDASTDAGKLHFKSSYLKNGHVNRNYWMISHIVEKTGGGFSNVLCAPTDPPRILFLRVVRDEDEDTTWSAYFSGDKVVFTAAATDASASTFFKSRVARASDSASTKSSDNFDHWRERNFPIEHKTTAELAALDASKYGAYIVDANEGGTNESVVVGVTGLSSLTSKSGDEMLLIAEKAHVRAFQFPRTTFDADLLERSPRDIKGQEEKAAMFAKSTQKELAPSVLDFFLSHSWDEEGVDRRVKIDALERFFKREGGDRTLWLDKVCIDTTDDTAKNNAITGLPITVGACKKVLVLLSPTYLQRIWCVFELQAVFAFCVKELAVDRVIIVDAGGGGELLKRAALAWTIDHAHCFDPNEELRLRRLAAVLGVERFNESIRNLATCEVVRFADLV